MGVMWLDTPHSYSYGFSLSVAQHDAGVAAPLNPTIRLLTSVGNIYPDRLPTRFTTKGRNHHYFQKINLRPNYLYMEITTSVSGWKAVSALCNDCHISSTIASQIAELNWWFSLFALRSSYYLLLFGKPILSSFTRKAGPILPPCKLPNTSHAYIRFIWRTKIWGKSLSFFYHVVLHTTTWTRNDNTPSMASPVDHEEPQIVSKSTDIKESKENGRADKLQTPSEPPNRGLRAWLCVETSQNTNHSSIGSMSYKIVSRGLKQ